MSRDKVVVGFFAVLAAVSAIGFALMLNYAGSDACLGSGGDGGSCPALALVNDERYAVSAVPPLPEIGQRLTEFGPIAATNSPERFADMTAYSVSGIDPEAVLIGNAADPAGEDGRYVLMFGPEQDDAWPALCAYLPPDQLAVTTECAASSGSNAP